MKKYGNIWRRFLFILFIIVISAMFNGCRDYEDEWDEGVVKGTAYYPFYTNGHPVYYDNQNFDIMVSLHDRTGEPIDIIYTGDSGFFRFTGISQGTYFLSAYVREYDEGYDIYYVYEAETKNFYVGEGDITTVSLYLVYTRDEIKR